MNIQEEMHQQLDDRVKLVLAMQAGGAIPTDISFLETPVMLVMHMSDDALSFTLKKFKKTRKRAIPFSLNARTYILPRRMAINLVLAEMSTRTFYKAQH